jgi:hypothetical protein
MSILLSDVRNDVTVRNGTLGCQASSLGGLTVLELGAAQVSGCFLDALSTTQGAPRIDVDGDLGLGNLDEDSFSNGTLAIEDGGVVDVDGTLFIRPLATLNLDGGTLRVSHLVNEGTLNENGGMLIVPEAAGAAPARAAAAALAALGRRRARSRIA